MSWLPLVSSPTPSLPLFHLFPPPSSPSSLASHFTFSSPPLTPSHSSHTPLLLPPLFTPSFLSLLPHFPEEKYGCEVCIIPADFSEGQELYPRIAKELQDLDIGVLGKVPSSFLASNSQPLTIFCIIIISL